MTPPPRPAAKTRPPLPPDYVESDYTADMLAKDKARNQKVYWDAGEHLWYRLDLWQDSGNGANAKGDLLERLETRIYSAASKPKEPTTRFNLAGVNVCTPGNLTAISAAPKAGKTAVVGAMLAATFANGERDCLGWTSENPAGHAVIHFDTEQCPFDHWQLVSRAVSRAGVSAAPDWLRSYCVTGFSHGDIREDIRWALDVNAQKFGGIHSFILDGAADAIADVNDAAEANEFVTEIHALAIQYDCPIIGVIHLNPGTSKTRGHLGSQLERKAETNLQLEQDEDATTIIYSTKNRRAPIPKKSAPCFAWDDSRHMHVTVENPAEAKAEAKDDAKREAMRQTAGVIFAEDEKLAHGELLKRLIKRERLERSGARRRIEKWLENGAVTKDDAGLYHKSS